MKLHNEPVSSMTAENVEQFDMWILHSSDLVPVVIPDLAFRIGQW
jgi:hypothetical protein